MTFFFFKARMRARGTPLSGPICPLDGAAHTIFFFFKETLFDLKNIWNLLPQHLPGEAVGQHQMLNYGANILWMRGAGGGQAALLNSSQRAGLPGPDRRLCEPWSSEDKAAGDEEAWP